MGKKQDIINSARDLLSSNGIHATPITAIAKNANIAVGSIYTYFATKNILINEIFTDIKQSEKELIALVPQNAEVRTQIKYCYDVMLAYFLKNESSFNFLEQLTSSPIITKESIDQGYIAMNPLLEILRKGQKKKLIKKIAIDELLQIIGAMLFNNIRWILSNKTIRNKNNNHFNLVWDAIKQ